ncbi:hypothetical protein BGZ94_004652 [Podila epigama]|nr:hypothetical protein BGZ94_004652 [Podila epigama]
MSGFKAVDKSYPSEISTTAMHSERLSSMDAMTLNSNGLEVQEEWDPSLERVTFGNQHPFATVIEGPSSADGQSGLGPTAPVLYTPHLMPSETPVAPPVYSSTAPYVVPSAPVTAYPPQEHSHQPIDQESENIFLAAPPVSYPQYQVPIHTPVSSQYYPQEYDPQPPDYVTNRSHETTPLLPRPDTTKQRFNVPKMKTMKSRYTKCLALLLLTVVALICWKVWHSMMVFGDTCSLPDIMGTEEGHYNLRSDTDFDLSLSITDMIGNVVVKESEDWLDEKIVVKYAFQASSTALFDSFGNEITTDSSQRKARIAFLIESDSADETRRLLQGNCARVDVAIVYPRTRPGTGRLKITMQKGSAHFQFEKVHGYPPPSFDVIEVEAEMADIRLENVLVNNSTVIHSTSGPVYGSLKTNGIVEANLVGGRIDLAVLPLKVLGVAPRGRSGLDINLSTMKGDVDLLLAPSFRGHFDLSAMVGSPAITSMTSDVIHYSSNAKTQLKGWTADDDVEPQGSLPRIVLRSGIGDVRTRIEPIAP